MTLLISNGFSDLYVVQRRKFKIMGLSAWKERLLAKTVVLVTWLMSKKDWKALHFQTRYIALLNYKYI